MKRLRDALDPVLQLLVTDRPQAGLDLKAALADGHHPLEPVDRQKRRRRLPG